MKIRNLIETKLVIGLSGRFQRVKLSNGNQAMSFVVDDGERYIIDASLKNYIRFVKWDNQKAIADIKKTLRKVKLQNGEKISTVKIRTNFNIKKDNTIETRTEKGDS